MKVSEVRPGMTGYGLSVFRGTKVERFEVEVIGQCHCHRVHLPEQRPPVPGGADAGLFADEHGPRGVVALPVRVLLGDDADRAVGLDRHVADLVAHDPAARVTGIRVLRARRRLHVVEPGERVDVRAYRFRELGLFAPADAALDLRVLRRSPRGPI